MDELQAAIDDIRDGNKPAAQRKLAQIIKNDPNNEQAWLWLSQVVDDPERQRMCLERVLRINPYNQAAQSQMAKLTAQPAVQIPAKSPTSNPRAPDIVKRVNQYTGRTRLALWIEKTLGLAPGQSAGLVNGMVLAALGMASLVTIIGVLALVIGLVKNPQGTWAFIANLFKIGLAALGILVLLQVLVSLAAGGGLLFKNEQQKKEKRRIQIEATVQGLPELMLDSLQTTREGSISVSNPASAVLSETALQLEKISKRDPQPILAHRLLAVGDSINNVRRYRPFLGSPPDTQLIELWEMGENIIVKLSQQLQQIQISAEKGDINALAMFLHEADQMIIDAHDRFCAFQKVFDEKKNALPMVASLPPSQPLPTRPLTCPQCGRSLLNIPNYCPYCRHKIRSSSQTDIEVNSIETVVPPTANAPKLVGESTDGYLTPAAIAGYLNDARLLPVSISDPGLLQQIRQYQSRYTVGELLARFPKYGLVSDKNIEEGKLVLLALGSNADRKIAPDVHKLKNRVASRIFELAILLVDTLIRLGRPDLALDSLSKDVLYLYPFLSLREHAGNNLPFILLLGDIPHPATAKKICDGISKERSFWKASFSYGYFISTNPVLFPITVVLSLIYTAVVNIVGNLEVRAGKGSHLSSIFLTPDILQIERFKNTPTLDGKIFTALHTYSTALSKLALRDRQSLEDEFRQRYHPIELAVIGLALAQIGSALPVERLKQLTQDTDFVVRTCAYEGLIVYGELNGQPPGQYQLAGLKDKDDSVSMAVANLFCQTRNPIYIHPTITAIETFTSQRRRLFITILKIWAVNGSSEALAQLQKLKQWDPDQSVRNLAAQCLSSLKS